MRIAAPFAVLLAVALAGPVQAQTPAKPAGKPAVSQTKDPKAELMATAQDGDAQAQHRLGMAYLTGKGVRGIKRDTAEGLSWLALAAAGGVTEAALELARAYDKGQGVTRDEIEAARWWLRAGRLGDEGARARFIEALLSGRAPGIAAADAIGWLEVKAQQGDLAAMLDLGALLEAGKVVPVDPAKAAHWYREAALGGEAEGAFRLGRLHLNRPGYWQAKSRNEIKIFSARPTQRQARDEGVDAEDVEYARPHMLQAEYWLRRAAREGHAGAQFLLGKAFVDGLDLPFSLRGATIFLQAGAERGHPAAAAAFARLVEKGQGVHGPDPVRAWAEYELAVHGGAKEAAGARDALAKAMSPRQLARARQIAQDLKELRGL